MRPLSPEAVIRLACDAGLSAIEWGGDVHVPHGETAVAKQVGRQTLEAGLEVVCYGSYYRMSAQDGKNPDPQALVDTAQALGAPCIRVWAGVIGSAEADEDDYGRMADEALALASLAQQAGVKIGFECHANTLTDTTASASKLLSLCEHPAITSLWQPYNGAAIETNVASLETLIPRLAHVHVFHWTVQDSAILRHPLSEGTGDWSRYLGLLKERQIKTSLMMEFVKDDNPEQLIQDARCLHELINSL